MKRVAGYVRVSSREQAELGWSLEAQERAIAAFCASRGWPPPTFYREPGRSAWTDAVDKRPAFARLLADVRAGEVGTVICWKLDRWARNLRICLNELHTLERAGCGFASVTESLDLTTPFGRAMLAILGIFAQLASDQTSERVRLGIAQAQLAGRYHGAIPFGAVRVDGRLQLDPARVDDLRAFLELAASLSDGAAARALNERGIAARHGGPWGDVAVARTRRRGAAWLLDQPDPWPALYRAARDRPTRPAVRAGATVNLLSGLLRCPCGGRVVYNPVGRDEKPGYRLRCQAARGGYRSRCGRRRHRAEVYERAVERWLMGVPDPARAIPVAGDDGHEAARAALEAERRRVVALYRRGLMRDDELDAARAELAAAEAALPRGPARLRQVAAGLRAGRAAWPRATVAARNAFLAGLLAWIEVEGDALTLALRPEVAETLGCPARMRLAANLGRGRHA